MKPFEPSPSQSLTNPMTTSGDIIYGDTGGTPARLAKGSDGMCMRISSGIPAWGFQSVASKTTAYTITTSDDVIFADASGAAFTLTMPTASTCAGKVIRILKTDSTLNAITVSGPGKTLNTQYEQRTFISDGTSWQLIDWQTPNDSVAYTPIFAGFGTVTNIEAHYVRTGKFFRSYGKATSGTVTATIGQIGLLSGLTIDSSVTLRKYAGRYVTSIATGSAQKDFALLMIAGNSYVETSIVEYAAALSALSIQQVASLHGTCDFSWDFTVPIQGWGR